MPTPKPAPTATPMPILATAAPTPAPSTIPTNTLNGKAATPQREIVVPWLRFFPLTVIVPDTGLTRQFQSIRLVSFKPWRNGTRRCSVPSGDVLCARRKRPRRRPTEKRNKLPPTNHEEFSSRVGLPSCFGLETSILAGGRAGSNRAVLTTAGWSAPGTFRKRRSGPSVSAHWGKPHLRHTVHNRF